MARAKKYEMNMTEGALLPKVLLFSLPLIASGVLQLLFNAADMVVVGQWAGKECLAAVGSTGSLINLMVNVFIGLSVGGSVAVAGPDARIDKLFRMCGVYQVVERLA
jgi:Na+-driven multidrug efflux pump